MSERREPASITTGETPFDACTGTRARLHRRNTAGADTGTDGGMA
ncbi:hypothetical protein BDK88_2680 [Natrinema hispanicum]|uniref:Uncharacterized protein n=1 Tax=Natrinema hispanicum TaxID=392421 RepID=A0A482YAT0_9EURY|nr:hypothetical protein [Natrinema hispanicum]RZV08606.1 hypothetical protein BDK88_2680 [Natrinema hispanicum]